MGGFLLCWEEKEGLLQWNWNAKNRGNKESEVLSLLSEGLMQKDIAAQLNISEGQVSKIKNKLVQNGQWPLSGKIIKGKGNLMTQSLN